MGKCWELRRGQDSWTFRVERLEHVVESYRVTRKAPLRFCHGEDWERSIPEKGTSKGQALQGHTWRRRGQESTVSRKEQGGRCSLRVDSLVASAPSSWGIRLHPERSMPHRAGLTG